jgi:hypothetical protein
MRLIVTSVFSQTSWPMWRDVIQTLMFRLAGIHLAFRQEDLVDVSGLGLNPVDQFNRTSRAGPRANECFPVCVFQQRVSTKVALGLARPQFKRALLSWAQARCPGVLDHCTK